MGLPSELLEILACPRCKGTVVLTEEALYLACHTCRLQFPIVDGIPVMLIDEAIGLDES
jgi:uncharacterized protein YbaR (Trm112 family)